jgi:acyl-CoA thioesterase
MLIHDFLKRDRYADLSGIELIELEEGYAKAQMKITPYHLNAGGVCQGGAIFTLADFAFAAAVNRQGLLTVSINSTINFFHSERDGYLYAEAREINNHHKLPYCEVKITNKKDDLIAVFNATGYRKNVNINNLMV